ncbi:unnamed protein product [Caenorhabditis bovis]|uniref:small monomeric GTPase n=1 Tax=Caenorhabditis bovis TaxID=2654633 RepID=A0A8S1F537_9PELO|nr:unnamed protein product [Caenorhabditis bovis]
MRNNTPLKEFHVALVGMSGSGKSAIAVKYITKRFIAEYDSTLEDTYCRQETIAGHCVMVWIMDTVENAARDEMRWITWADIYVVIYDVTSQLSFQYAEGLLERISRHEHVLCAREHRTLLVGNKNDLERYRQVSEAEGERLAVQYKACFSECSTANDIRQFTQTLHTTFQNIITGARSPSPRQCSSDSEIITPRKGAFSALRSSSRSSQVRAKTSATKNPQRGMRNFPQKQKNVNKLDALLKSTANGAQKENNIDKVLTTKVDRLMRAKVEFMKDKTDTGADLNESSKLHVLIPDIDSEVRAAIALKKLGIVPRNRLCRVEPDTPAFFKCKVIFS